jgi:hypothetical protein
MAEAFGASPGRTARSTSSTTPRTASPPRGHLDRLARPYSAAACRAADGVLALPDTGYYGWASDGRRRAAGRRLRMPGPDGTSRATPTATC